MSDSLNPSKRALLIGWDAADWKAIHPLIDAGKMPNLAKFVNEGVMGNIATLQPVLSPMLWSSIATGKRPYKHGIHGFSEPDPVTGGIRPVTNLSRKTKAVWNILNQNDLNTITVGWWPSNPAEPLSKGVMVSNDYQTAHGNSATPEALEKWRMKPGTVHPERLVRPLKKLRVHPGELKEGELMPFIPGIEGMSREDLNKVEKDPRLQSLMKIIADCSSVHAAATATMQTEPWDLMCVYYDAIDHFGHAFMKYHPPQRPGVSDFDFWVFSNCIEAGYIYHDLMLGTLLRQAGEDTTVILMSDHGFHPDDLRLSNIPREPAGPAAEHRQFGIFAAKGPGIRQDARIAGANLLDICPTLLHLFGLPVGEDMDGKVLLDIYEGSPDAIERIPSWDDVEGDHGMHPPDKQISAEDSKAALEQLVALGYIDEPDADQSKAMEQTVRELDYNLAQAYIDGGIYTEAIVILERLYGKWPMEHRFGFKLATCYQSLGRAADLRELVGTIIKRRVDEANEAGAALKALNLNDEEAGKAEQERVEKMSAQEKKKFSRERRELIGKARPNLYSLRYLEASADVAERSYESALEKLEQLDSSRGARRNALVLRGEILQRLKRWPESRVAFEESLEIDRESPGPLLGLARTFLAEKKYEQAVGHTRASLGLLFFQPRAHYILGIALYRLGRWQEAEQAFKVCVSQAPLFSAAFRMLSQISRRHKGDPGETVFYKNQVKVARSRMAQVRADKQDQSRDLQREPLRAGDNPDSRPMPELQPRPEGLEAIDDDQVITIVSGLPRSGTSLMMQILEAAGISAFTDGHRAADDSNQKGYYEHEQVAGLRASPDKSWLTKTCGQSLKVVAPLLTSLPRRTKRGKGSEKLHYRVLFMEREMEEILDSQTTMLERLGKTAPSGDVFKAYLQQVRHAKTWLNGHGIPALSVNFSELVHDPERLLPQVAAFLGAEEHLDAMRSAIDPSLHRARKDAVPA
ncbi:MAG: alkaline phosphatase family protein [Planctomycetota bacterium]|nr:alkaline phosphatase family protein [Planctomycetota bacterium]